MLRVLNIKNTCVKELFKSKHFFILFNVKKEYFKKSNFRNHNVKIPKFDLFQTWNSQARFNKAMATTCFWHISKFLKIYIAWHGLRSLVITNCSTCNIVIG